MNPDDELHRLRETLRNKTLAAKALRQSLGDSCDQCGAAVTFESESFECGECEIRDDAGTVVNRTEWTGDMYVTFYCPNCGPRRKLWRSGN